MEFQCLHYKTSRSRRKDILLLNNHLLIVIGFDESDYPINENYIWHFMEDLKRNIHHSIPKKIEAGHLDYLLLADDDECSKLKFMCDYCLTAYFIDSMWERKPNTHIIIEFKKRKKGLVDLLNGYINVMADLSCRFYDHILNAYGDFHIDHFLFMLNRCQSVYHISLVKDRIVLEAIK